MEVTINKNPEDCDSFNGFFTLCRYELTTFKSGAKGVEIIEEFEKSIVKIKRLKDGRVYLRFQSTTKLSSEWLRAIGMIVDNFEFSYVYLNSLNASDHSRLGDMLLELNDDTLPF